MGVIGIMGVITLITLITLIIIKKTDSPNEQSVYIWS